MSVCDSVGTVELAFLSVSPCQLLFRSSTQETCAPAEKAWQTHTQQPASGSGIETRENERHRDTERKDEREGGTCRVR